MVRQGLVAELEFQTQVFCIQEQQPQSCSVSPGPWLCVHSPALFHRHQPQFCFSLHPEMKEELCTGASPADCPGSAAPFLFPGSSFFCPKEMFHSLETQ